MRYGTVRSALAPLLFALTAAAAGGGGPDGRWHPDWAARKRVRVRLPAMKALGFPFRPPPKPGKQAPQEPLDDIVPARASIVCGDGLAASTAPREIRVVDAGGNVLPCTVTHSKDRGVVHVVFPARHTIAGQLAGRIEDHTKEVRLSVGRNKAVSPGMLFHVVSAGKRLALLEVKQVDAAACTAHVIDKSMPAMKKGLTVRSEPLTDAEYFLYYGNPNAKPTGPTWQPPTLPVRQVVWRTANAPRELEELAETMRTIMADAAGRTPAGLTRRSTIDSRSNELVDPGEGYLLALFDGFIHCPVAGLYRFSVDTSGPTLVFVNGQLIVKRGGFFGRPRGLQNWEHRGKVELDAGYHRLLFFATKTAKTPVARLGWKPIGASGYVPAPASLFARHVQARVVGYETRAQRQQVFFTAAPAHYALTTDAEAREPVWWEQLHSTFRDPARGGKGRRLHQFVQFHNHTTVSPSVGRDDVTYYWDFGDGETSRHRHPGHLFVIADPKKPPTFGVTLHTYLAGRHVGQYRRTVHCDPGQPVKADLSAAIVSFADIAYADERTSIAVRLHNLSRSPVILRGVAFLRDPKARRVVVRRKVFIPPENETFCIVPVDLKELPSKRADIQIKFYLDTEEVLSVLARIIPSPSGLSGLKTRRGALYDTENRRVMICAEIEDADRHLRWVVPRYVRDEVYAQAAATRRRVLLFGDRMATPVAPDQSFTDYVALLTKQLEESKRSLQFVPRTSGRLPTLADVVRFAKTLDGLETLPDIIVISPGLADVEQATGERDFTRAIDVMVDAVRVKDARIKIVVVSPPPYPPNPALSAHYTKALERLARVHHLGFVNLATLLTDQKDWPAAYYAPPHTSGILLHNPNEAAHRRIADAILATLR